MSRNVVRKPLTAPHSASRTLDERLMLRFPRFFRAVGRLVALVEVSVRGQGSGIGFERQVAFVWTLDHEAKGVREQVYLDWGDALEAVELSE